MSPRLVLPLLLVLFASGCATLSQRDLQASTAIVEAGHAAASDCRDGDDPACQPVASPLLGLGGQAVAASTDDAPRHHVTLLDRGQDGLIARLHLIRAARESIDLQSFIYDVDDSGLLVLDELLAAVQELQRLLGDAGEVVVQTPMGDGLQANVRAYLGADQLYACMAESVLMGLSGMKQHYSYGDISREQVQQIRALAATHGFSLAQFKTDNSL